MATIPNFSSSYWIDSIKAQEYPVLENDIAVDVLVIGAGITGITTAYLLQKEGLKVAVVDSDKILSGTTGYTTAKITIQHGLIYDKLKLHFGEEKARIYGEANKAGLQLIKDLINEHKIDCDFVAQNSYVYTQSESYVKAIEDEVKTAQELGLNAQYLDTVPLPFKVQAAICFQDQAMFHPRKYLIALCNLLNSKEQCIYESTRALNIEHSPVGNKSLVTTLEDGIKVHSNYAVIASHFPFYDGYGMYFARMFSSRSYVLAVKTKKNFEEGMYISAEDPKRSLRYTPINGEKIVLVSGEHHITGQDSNTMVHYEALRDFVEQNYGINEILYRWSTQDLTTLDDVPYIGYLAQGKPNVFVATGFKKWGMTTGSMAAILIRDMIVKKESPWIELFTPSRFVADPSLRNLVKEGAMIAKEFIKGKLKAVPETSEDLAPDTAKIINSEGNKIGAYKDQQGCVHFVDTTCRHMGCEVQWNNAERTWDCPCHGSRYDIQGNVIEGPALKPLKKINK